MNREPIVLGGRFRLERLIKSGQGIETFRATDIQNGHRVIVKSAFQRQVVPATIQRLEHEAEVMKTLKSPHLSSLIAAGVADERFFLAMEHVEGATLESRLRRAALPPLDAIAVVSGILRALDVIHDAGVLHRDVKPSNVMLEPTPQPSLPPELTGLDAESVGSARLIDFGLARSGRLDSSIRDQPVGTVRYMSPEGAGLIAQNVDARSDLYSVGVVLFECLTGHPPFSAANVGELLRQHLTERPQDLTTIASVPHVLDDVVQRLLSKDPRDRYHTAKAVLFDLDLIAHALRQGDCEPTIVVGTHDRRGSLAEPAFVGRAHELSQLDGDLQSAYEDQGSLVWIEAPSGGGKSRFLDQLSDRARKRGLWVFRGQGLALSAQRPFRLFDGIVRELVETLSADPQLKTDLVARLGEHVEAICGALPALAPLFGVSTPSTRGPESFGENRTVTALTVLLNSIGTAARPAVLLLDDGQWMDELTTKLVVDWARSRGEALEYARNPSSDASTIPKPSIHMTIVVAYRSDEIASDHAFRKVPNTRTRSLAPLGTTAVRQLLESMAGPLPDNIVDTVCRLSEGSPFMAGALLQGMVEARALVPDRGTWKIDTSRLEEVQSSRKAATMLVRRLEALSPEAQRFLQVGAVLGKTFDIEDALRLADLTSRDVSEGLKEARRRQIVWIGANETECAFVHDKIRETFLGRLAPSLRRELHEKAATVLSQRDPDRIYELAFHYDAADLPAQAFPFALAAAREARKQSSLDIAESQYLIAERGVVALPTDNNLRMEVFEGLGDVLMLRGKYDEAEQRFTLAQTCAQDAVAKARIAAKFGELEFKRGDIEAATTALEDGLSLLGRNIPQSSWAMWILMLGAVIVQLFHATFPKLFLHRKPAPSDEQRWAIRLYSRLSYVYYFRNTWKASFCHLREVNLAEVFHPTPELGQAYSAHCAMLASLGLIEQAIRYGKKGLQIRTDLGDHWGRGQSLGFLSIAYFSGARYEECLRTATEAIAVLERAGDRWEGHLGHYQTGLALLGLGRYSQATALAKHVYANARNIEDLQAAGICLVIWARCSSGAISARSVGEIMEKIGSDLQSTANLLHADGLRLFHAGRFSDAATRFEKAIAITTKAGLANAYIAPITAWLVTTRRTQADRCSPLHPADRKRFLRAAHRALRRARWAAFLYPGNRPHVYRERALLAAAGGGLRAARKWIRRSIEASEAQHAEEERWASVQVLARLDHKPVGGHRNSPDAPYDETASDSGHLVSLSLADRFSSVLDAGHRIASALSKDAIYQAMLDAAATLLRSNHNAIVEGNPQPSTVFPANASFSRSIYDRASSTREVVVVDTSETDDVSESVVLSNVRSVICVPFEVRGQVVGCLYASHERVAGLFQEDDIRLARFIAVTAGAALENAEGFARAEALSRTLERRVTERTQELESTLEELRRSQDRLLHISITDELTQLYTRRFLVESLNKLLQLSRREPVTISCLLIDVDHFKKVNDTFGHPAGDQVLRKVAGAIRDTVRLSDVAGRYGGEEFMVLLPSTDLKGAQIAAEKIRERIQHTRYDNISHGPVTASIGVAVFHSPTPIVANTTDLAAALVEEADRALYRAKTTGRNRVVAADTPVSPQG